ASDIDAINTLLGPGVGNVYGVSKAWADAQVLATRLHDSTPFNGGDAITDYATGSCTTGFGVTIAGHARLTTAAHCFANGAVTYNALQDPATGDFTSPQSTATPLGTVSSQQITFTAP